MLMDRKLREQLIAGGVIAPAGAQASKAAVNSRPVVLELDEAGRDSAAWEIFHAFRSRPQLIEQLIAEREPWLAERLERLVRRWGFKRRKAQMSLNRVPRAYR